MGASTNNLTGAKGALGKELTAASSVITADVNHRPMSQSPLFGIGAIGLWCFYEPTETC